MVVRPPENIAGHTKHATDHVTDHVTTTYRPRTDHIPATLPTDLAGGDAVCVDVSGSD